MRPPQDRRGVVPATPIYDALCDEYRRLFRALPGDRSGEEELRFTAFGGDPRADAHHGHGYAPPSGLTAGAYATAPPGAPLPHHHDPGSRYQPRPQAHPTGMVPVWQGRPGPPRTALPPARRRSP
ncbi:hypothetical protein ACWD6I_08570 [Streptomyces sp. NPDC002454]|uniref:hypothetical protein n=1 Tax=Streptomyces sp. NPDC002490 TaxID=3154416 RepID=UPI003318B4EA